MSLSSHRSPPAAPRAPFCTLSVALALWLGPAALAAGAGPVQVEAAGEVNGAGAYRERIVKRFDFTEPDNLDDIPKYWEEFGGESFPRFVSGGFDRNVGRESPPSFHLRADGRNVAFRYRGIETPIRPHTDYLVVGWIKPDRLRHARATITAYYLDYNGLPLPGTQRQGHMIGGDETDDWQRVNILLPAGPRQAFGLGLTLWVEQAEIWNPDARPPRHIERVDVHGGAWFDDIVIYRLPQVELAAPAMGNVFERPRPPVLTVTLTDDDPRGLEGELAITDGADQVVLSREISVPCESHSVPLGDLPAGWYRARLAAKSASATVVERHLAFVVLNPMGVGAFPASAFGVVLEPPPQDDAPDRAMHPELALLAALNVGAVKIPLWTGRAEAPGLAENADALDAMLNALLRRRVDVTGVLGGTPPEVLRRAGIFARPLLDLLSDPVESWRGFLSSTVAPYASVLTSWQLGPDDHRDPAITDDPRFAQALAAVREELAGMMSALYLTAPGSIGDDPMGQALPVERVTLGVPRGVRPDWVGAHLSAHRDLGYLQVGAYIQPTPASQYARLARLADWAARVIETRHAGANPVYIPAPWHWRPQAAGDALEPTEDFVAYRTIVSVLREALPDGELIPEPGVRALLFTQGDRTALAVWDPAAPPEGRELELHLGEAAEALDLWGRSAPLERTAEGRHRLRLTALPQFVRRIERWVAVFGREVKLLPEVVSFSLAAHRHELRLSNPSDALLAGEVTLETPESWQVRPRHLEFSIGPGESIRRPIELKYSHNEAAGPKTLWADVGLSGQSRYRLRVPLRFELGIADVDVWGYAVTAGEGIIVRHGVRNRSAAPISFRSFAAAPGRDRQYKLIVALAPGMTEVKEYRFGRAADLSGRSIRLGLREVNGARMHNLDVTVP